MSNPRAMRPLTVAAAVAMALSGRSLPAWSADGGAKSNTTLEEIVVTAQRREQSVQDIPFNISAISGTALERANIIDAVDALRLVSGISMIDRGYRASGVTNGIIIRGINVDSGSQGDVPLASPPTVATYVDNTSLSGSFIIQDLNRVEVLRGPQGTLYGSGSLAGNVRYIMNKPELDKFSGRASMGYGVTDGSDGENLNPDLMLNVPVTDTLALRMNIGQVKNSGIIDYPNLYVLDSSGNPLVVDANGNPSTATADIINGKPVYRKATDVDTVDIKYGRISALFKPNDVFNAQLSYQKQQDEIGGRRQVTQGANLATGGSYGKFDFGAIQVEPSNRTIDMTALELEFDLGFATLTSSSSHYDHNGTIIGDNSGVYARNGWFYSYGSSPRPMAQAQRFFDDSANTQEFRMVSNGHHSIDWTAGLYYTDQDSKIGQNSYLVGYIPYLNAINWYGLAPYTTNQDFLFRRDQTYKELAGFGEITFNLRDNLHLTAGARYFNSKVDVNATVAVPIYADPGGTGSKDINDTSYLVKTNLAWDLNEHSMVYGTYSQGYRHAGANAVPTLGKYAENPAYITFNSDTDDNYELGFKGTLPRLAYSVSAYYTAWHDPQLNTSTPNWGFFAVVNGQSASTQGIELELSGQLTDSLSYSFGYTYADAKLTSDVYVPAGNAGGVGILYPDLISHDGDRLPGSPKNILNVSLSHHLTLTHGITMDTVLNGYYQSDMVNSLGNSVCLSNLYSPSGLCRDSARPTSIYYEPTSTFTRSQANIDGFQIWNLSTTFTKDKWDVSLYGKNLFNETGTTGVVPFLVAGSNTSPAQNYYGNNSRNYIALPRTIGLVVGYKF